MTSKNGELVIMAVGEVIVNRPDPRTVFERISSVLKQGDIVIGDLEAPMCDRGDPLPGKVEVGASNLKTGPHNVDGLESGGFNVMALANNHNMDYGWEGLEQSMELLDKAKIAYTGGGKNLEEAHKPAILERNGVRVATLSYTSVYPHVGFAAEDNKPGLATVKIHTSYQAPENVFYQPGYPPLTTTLPDPAEKERMLADVKQARQHADIVLVAFHWGISWGYGHILGYQKELGRAAIEAGADLIMGAHPLNVMGMEMYKGKLLCYSMGNFVMDGQKLDHFGSDTIIVKCRVENKRITKYSLIPVQISSVWQPHPSSHEEGVALMKKVESMSAEFGTTFSMENGEIVIGGPKPGTPEARRGFEIEPHRGLPVLVDATFPPPYIFKKLRGITDGRKR